MQIAINGDKTQLNLFNAGWWGNRIKENAIFQIRNGEYCLTFLVEGEWNQRTYLKECSVELLGLDALNRPWGRLFENVIIKK